MSFFNKLKKSSAPEVRAQDGEPGELSLDAYETKEDLVLQSTIAGVEAKDVNVSIENGVLTITGKRQRPEPEDGQKYFCQECFWGSFSRQLALPQEVDESRIEAKMKDGVLTLRLPKIQKKRRKKIVIKED